MVALITEENDELEMIKYICKNKKNTSHIQEYLVKLEQGTGDEMVGAIHILTGVFSFYIKKGTWHETQLEIESDIVGNDIVSVDSNSSKHIDAKTKVNCWLHASYKAFITLLLQYVFGDSSPLQLPCLESLMSLIHAEYMTSMQENTSSLKVKKLNSANHIFIKMVKQFLITGKVSDEVLDYTKSLIHDYDDLCFYWLKNIHILLDKENIAEKYTFAMEFIPKNAHAILSAITRKGFDPEKELILFINSYDPKEYFDVKKFRNVLSSAWMALMQLPNLPKVIQKKILVDLDTKIMPQLVDPKLLIDFLTDSYDAGGVCSLLALNGLFVLINQFNLDYPEFYNKLYILLDVTIFHTRYKARFFYLLDLFLSSTHLPSYLVCAFIKKLARMALFTPGENMILLLKFIRNLLIKHPSSRILIHRINANDEEKLLVDPFLSDEGDPFKCNAGKSCLWELESLKSHYSKDVRKLIFSFRKEFPLVEDDLTDHFEADFESLIQPKIDEEINEEKLPPFNFEKNTDIFSINGGMWSL